jgi:predicted transcriptional regulator of viral defense system
MARKSKYDPLFKKLVKKLPKAFKRFALDKALDDVLFSETHKEVLKKGLDLNTLDEWTKGMYASDFENTNQRKGLRRLVNNNITELKYKIHGNIKPAKIYSLEEDEVDGFDFAGAFATQNLYFSNISALYILGLIDQKPLTHYICKELHSGASGEYEYDEDIAKMTFRKKPRVSNRYISYKNTKVYFLEKQNIDNIGVEEIVIKKKDKESYSIKCTGLERTFLDSIITPQYSGGIDLLISVFKRKKLDLDKLAEIYNAIDPVYPYWQKIGYIFDLMGKNNESEKWANLFVGKEKKLFFADREYRSDWSLNTKWKIYHPKRMGAD